jgi:hypothetical protein
MTTSNTATARKSSLTPSVQRVRVPVYAHTTGADSLPAIALHKGALHIGGAPVQASFKGNSCYWERRDEAGRDERGVLDFSLGCMLAEGRVTTDGQTQSIKATADLKYNLLCRRKSDGKELKLIFSFGAYYGGADAGTVFFCELSYYDASGTPQALITFDRDNPAPQPEFSPHIQADGKMAFDIDFSAMWATIGGFLWPDFFLYNLSFALDDTYSAVSRGTGLAAVAKGAQALMDSTVPGEAPPDAQSAVEKTATEASSGDGPGKSAADPLFPDFSLPDLSLGDMLVYCAGDEVLDVTGQLAPDDEKDAARVSLDQGMKLFRKDAVAMSALKSRHLQILAVGLSDAAQDGYETTIDKLFSLPMPSGVMEQIDKDGKTQQVKISGNELVQRDATEIIHHCAAMAMADIGDNNVKFADFFGQTAAEAREKVFVLATIDGCHFPHIEEDLTNTLADERVKTYLTNYTKACFGRTLTENEADPMMKKVFDGVTVRKGKNAGQKDANSRCVFYLQCGGSQNPQGATNDPGYNLLHQCVSKYIYARRVPGLVHYMTEQRGAGVAQKDWAKALFEYARKRVSLLQLDKALSMESSKATHLSMLLNCLDDSRHDLSQPEEGGADSGESGASTGFNGIVGGDGRSLPMDYGTALYGLVTNSLLTRAASNMNLQALSEADSDFIVNSLMKQILSEIYGTAETRYLSDDTIRKFFADDEMDFSQIVQKVGQDQSILMVSQMFATMQAAGNLQTGISALRQKLSSVAQNPGAVAKGFDKATRILGLMSGVAQLAFVGMFFMQWDNMTDTQKGLAITTAVSAGLNTVGGIIRVRDMCKLANPTSSIADIQNAATRLTYGGEDFAMLNGISGGNGKPLLTVEGEPDVPTYLRRIKLDAAAFTSNESMWEEVESNVSYQRTPRHPFKGVPKGEKTIRDPMTGNYKVYDYDRGVVVTKDFQTHAVTVERLDEMGKVVPMEEVKGQPAWTRCSVEGGEEGWSYFTSDPEMQAEVFKDTENASKLRLSEYTEAKQTVTAEEITQEIEEVATSTFTKFFRVLDVFSRVVNIALLGFMAYVMFSDLKNTFKTYGGDTDMGRAVRAMDVITVSLTVISAVCDVMVLSTMFISTTSLFFACVPIIGAVCAIVSMLTMMLGQILKGVSHAEPKRVIFARENILPFVMDLNDPTEDWNQSPVAA